MTDDTGRGVGGGQGRRLAPHVQAAMAAGARPSGARPSGAQPSGVERGATGSSPSSVQPAGRVAPHVQAAIARTAQPRLAPGAPSSTAPLSASGPYSLQAPLQPASRLAPHVQGAIARAAQPKVAPGVAPGSASGVAARQPAPHVQAALGGAVQRKSASAHVPAPASPHVPTHVSGHVPARVQGAVPVAVPARTPLPAPVSHTGAGAIQEMRLGKRNHWRAVKLKQALERAYERGNASQIECLIFHNSKQIFRRKARTYSEMGYVDTPYAYEREEVPSQESRSKDGEIHILPMIENFLPGYVANINESFVDQNYWTSPSLPFGGRHKIEIELIGPYGSCGDCEMALQIFANRMQYLYGKTRLGAGIDYRVNTRYWFASSHNVWEVNRGPNRSTRYGNERAYRTRGFSFNPKFRMSHRYRVHTLYGRRYGRRSPRYSGPKKVVSKHLRFN